MNQTNSPNTSTGLEIAARMIKIVIMIGTSLIWIAYVIWAYSVYQVWTVDRQSSYFFGTLTGRVHLGWYCIAFIVLVRAVQRGMGWAILAPIEARILGINIRDPEVAKELRNQSWMTLALEAINFIVLIAIPLLIAHFRFDFFK